VLHALIVEGEPPYIYKSENAIYTGEQTTNSASASLDKRRKKIARDHKTRDRDHVIATMRGIESLASNVRLRSSFVSPIPALSPETEVGMSDARYLTRSAKEDRVEVCQRQLMSDLTTRWMEKKDRQTVGQNEIEKVQSVTCHQMSTPYFV
jgi:hypothetical protein